jgi:DNA-binding MarR family transcriptional regulator
MTRREDKLTDRTRQPRLLYLARRFAVASRAELETITRDHGLTAGDYSLLHLISRRQPCSSADIARAARITPQAATQQVAQLAAKTMIERRENPDNRRIVLLELTDGGRNALEYIDRRAAALEDRLTVGFDDAELDIIRRFLSLDPSAAADSAEAAE